MKLLDVGQISGGAVRLMRTRIRLLGQPEPMRSIVGAVLSDIYFLVILLLFRFLFIIKTLYISYF
jgi:hypothetical protein